jgi:hypothetical protein
MTDDAPPVDTGTSPRTALGDLLKLGVVVLFPPLYLSLDRVDVLNGEFGGFDPRRLLWAAPLFYGVGLVATTLAYAPGLSPGALASVGFDGGLLADVLFYHLVVPLGVLGGEARLGVPSAVVVVVVGGLAALAGRQLKRLTDSRRAAGAVRAAGEDRYVVPTRSVKRREGIGSSFVPMKRNQSMLVLGQPGVGKTESIKLLANQMTADPDEPFVVFDYKDEYQGLFDDDRTVVLSLTGSTVRWNVFREVDHEREFDEVAKRFFTEEEADRQGDNAFFVKGARQVLSAILKYHHRRYDAPTNADLADYVRRKSYDEVAPDMERAGHADLAGSVKSYLDPDASKMALSVFAFLQQTVNEVFTQEFAAEDGAFSVREYMRDPAGEVLILDMPSRGSESVVPAFRFFVDWAIQYALEDADRASYFILDEFARVPGLENIEDLTGAGRSRKAQGILGLQGISQLYSGYDENYADDILAGVTQEILMRTGDDRSTEYVQNRLGEIQYTSRREKPTKWYEFGPFASTQETVETAYPISEAEIQRFDRGEAVVMTEDGWARVQLPMWSDLPPGVRAGLTGDADDGGGGPSGVASEADSPTGSESGRPDAAASDAGQGAGAGGSSGAGGPGTGDAAGEPEAGPDERTGTVDGDDGGSVAEDSDAPAFCPSCGDDLRSKRDPAFCPSCGEELVGR